MASLTNEIVAYESKYYGISNRKLEYDLTTCEILTLINQLKSNKSTSKDLLSNEMPKFRAGSFLKTTNL